MSAPRDSHRKSLAASVVVGVVVSTVSGVVVALILDAIREERRAAALPQPVAPGHGSA